MPRKRNQQDDDVVRKAFPESEVVMKKSKRDPRFLPPDSTTPSVKRLHQRYKSDSAEESVLEKAQPTSSESATRAVVIGPKDQGDASPKRLTVLVKQGKIRAVQG